MEGKPAIILPLPVDSISGTGPLSRKQSDSDPSLILNILFCDPPATFTKDAAKEYLTIVNNWIIADPFGRKIHKVKSDNGKCTLYCADYVTRDWIVYQTKHVNVQKRKVVALTKELLGMISMTFVVKDVVDPNRVLDQIQMQNDIPGQYGLKSIEHHKEGTILKAKVDQVFAEFVFFKHKCILHYGIVNISVKLDAPDGSKANKFSANTTHGGPFCRLAMHGKMDSENVTLFCCTERFSVKSEKLDPPLRSTLTCDLKVERSSENDNMNAQIEVKDEYFDSIDSRDDLTGLTIFETMVKRESSGCFHQENKIDPSAPVNFQAEPKIHLRSNLTYSSAFKVEKDCADTSFNSEGIEIKDPGSKDDIAWTRNVQQSGGCFDQENKYDLSTSPKQNDEEPRKCTKDSKEAHEVRNPLQSKNCENCSNFEQKSYAEMNQTSPYKHQADDKIKKSRILKNKEVPQPKQIGNKNQNDSKYVPRSNSSMSKLKHPTSFNKYRNRKQNDIPRKSFRPWTTHKKCHECIDYRNRGPFYRHYRDFRQDHYNRMHPYKNRRFSRDEEKRRDK